MTTLADRFWAKVNKSGNCWVWTAAKFKGLGYGKFNAGGRTAYAHRFSYELAFGPIPSGLYVCHTCDNRVCVNPDHLFAGTAQDNVDDMIRKGRIARVSRPGEDAGNSKLKTEQVLRMRSRYRHDRRGDNKRAGIEFGVSTATANNILRRKTWRHL